MHNVLVPNLYVRLYADGTVLFSIRVSLTLSCPMNLKMYPLDTQKCPMQIASYGWATDDLVYIWKEKNPVQVKKTFNLETEISPLIIRSGTESPYRASS